MINYNGPCCCLCFILIVTGISYSTYFITRYVKYENSVEKSNVTIIKYDYHKQQDGCYYGNIIGLYPTIDNTTIDCFVNDAYATCSGLDNILTQMSDNFKINNTYLLDTFLITICYPIQNYTRSYIFGIIVALFVGFDILISMWCIFSKYILSDGVSVNRDYDIIV
jgi:hypothetical protein